MPPKYVSKYYTFSASTICQIAAGLAYCFSLYSDALKARFGYSQEQIEGVGSACNLGGYLSLPAGLFYDWLASRGLNHLAPRLTMGIGAACNVLGYLALWAAASGRIDLAYWQVIAFAVLACNSGAWIDVACLATSTRNFPGERGTVIGILKSTLGLSASIWTALYVGLFQPDAISFLLFLAFAPCVLTLGGACFVNAVPFEQAGEALASRRFLFTIQVLAALGVYQMATAIMEESATLALGHSTRLAITLGTLVLVAAIALVPWGTGGLWAQPLGEDERTAAAAPDAEAAVEAALPQTEVSGNAAADGEAERPLLREEGWGADEHGKRQARV